ncbi:lachesin-like [Arctopsyche grandis]|uniref:lachesin-like n=1 Tax=Arctopsyche grandis TaxID=121162 RepID=UPI00406D9B29
MLALHGRDRSKTSPLHTNEKLPDSGKLLLENTFLELDVSNCHLMLLLLVTRWKSPSFGEPIGNVTVPLGREAILTCIVDNLQTFKVAWLRVDTQTILTIAGHVITKNHRISLSQADRRAWRLHVRELREADRGWYMCQINTEPMLSQLAYLQVVVPPDIVDEATSSDVVVREGSSASLSCMAQGSPKPSITWRREDSRPLPLPNGTEALWFDGGQLTIAKTTRIHAGAYLCIASNGIPPSVSKRVTLNIQFTPMIWVQNQLVGAIYGHSVALECHSEASPKAINYWTREKGEMITNNDKYQTSIIENGYKMVMRLLVNSIEQEDLGTYKCVSKNSLGNTDGSIKVYGIPIPTTVATTTTTTTMATTTVTRGSKKPVKSRHNTVVHRPTPIPEYKNISTSDRSVKKAKEVSGTVSLVDWPQQHNTVSSNISLPTTFCDIPVIIFHLMLYFMPFSLTRL